MKDQAGGLPFPIYVHCYHPLVYRIIEKTLPEGRSIYPFSAPQLQGVGQCKCILIIDTHSVERWLEIAIRYGFIKRQLIILLTSNIPSHEEEMRIIHLGVRGVVPIANLENELGSAVESVTAGRLWVRRSTLTGYITQRNGSASPSPRFTMREEQIIACLLEGISNKEIGQLLGISTRTVKFHVANVLHKLNVKNRRCLQALKKYPQSSGPLSTTMSA